MSALQEKKLKELLVRYDKKIFGFALQLSRGNRDKAYDVAASAFAETAQSPASDGKAFLALLHAVMKKSSTADLAPVSDEDDFKDLKPAERNNLLYIRRAIQSLSFGAQAAVLLRDQLNLSYREMAVIFHTSEDEIKNRTLRARKEIRTRLQETLRDAR